MDFLTIEQYLGIKGIVVNERNFKRTENKSEFEDILNQVKLIARIHKILNGYPYGLSPSVKCKIGEDIEEMNFLYKKINKSFLMDCFPENIRKKVMEILIKAKSSIDYIKKYDYLSLFKRAMDNEEMILGDCGFKDLRGESSIEISSMKGISYNITEIDYGKFFVKLKKYGIADFCDELISCVVKEENLSSNSGNFLRGYVSYPHQTLNMLQKYKDGKIQYDEETFCLKFMKSYNSDCSEGL